MTIINGNMYVAGLSFVWFPSVLLLGSSVVFPKRTSIFTISNFVLLLLAGSAYLSTSISDVVNTSDGSFVNLQFCIFSYIIVSTVLFDNEMSSKIFKFYQVFTITICCIMCVNFVLRYGLSVNDRVSIRYFGITKDVNYLTSFLVPGYTIFFYKAIIGENRKLLLYCFIMLIAIFLAGSRSVFISALVSSILIYSKYTFKPGNLGKTIMTAIAILIASVVFLTILENNPLFARMTTTQNYDSNARLLIWDYALEAFYRNPMLGSGVESGSYFSQLSVRWVTHNAWLDILTGQGILGSVIMILFIHTLYRGIIKENKIFFVAFFVTCFLPLLFSNGYECATWWTPMLLCKIISDNCKRNTNILSII